MGAGNKKAPIAADPEWIDGNGRLYPLSVSSAMQDPAIFSRAGGNFRRSQRWVSPDCQSNRRAISMAALVNLLSKADCKSCGTRVCRFFRVSASRVIARLSKADSASSWCARARRAPGKSHRDGSRAAKTRTPFRCETRRIVPHARQRPSRVSDVSGVARTRGKMSTGPVARAAGLTASAARSPKWPSRWRRCGC